MVGQTKDLVIESLNKAIKHKDIKKFEKLFSELLNDHLISVGELGELISSGTINIFPLLPLFRLMEKKSPNINYLMGAVCAQGISENIDHNKARGYFEAAAENKKAPHAPSLNRLGYMYFEGLGVKKDSKMAKNYFERAAKLGYAVAQHNVSLELIGKNFVEHVRYTKLAADGGYAPAQYNLALYYIKGSGVEKNDNLARSYCEKAANQEILESQVMLGDFYAQGVGGDKDLCKAKDLYLQAANKGCDLVKDKLAILYALNSKDESIGKLDDVLGWFGVTFADPKNHSEVLQKCLQFYLQKNDIEEYKLSINGNDVLLLDNVAFKEKMLGGKKKCHVEEYVDSCLSSSASTSQAMSI